MNTIIPVILCGGSGTRLWPLSRQKKPKQFLKLLDEHTLLQKTAQRALEILDGNSKDIVAVTLGEMAEETRRQLEDVTENAHLHMLEEPEARNTAAAVACAVCYIEKIFGTDAYVWILPADHHIGNKTALKEAVYKAVKAADDSYLVTFGIDPTRPETGYGYIQKDKAVNGSGAYGVREFYEKPQEDIAQQFVTSGKYLWSSGMHLFKAATAIENFQAHALNTWESVVAAMTNPGHECRPEKSLYGKTEKEPFETAVLEKSRRVAVVPCNPQWSDIGSWESLWEIRHKDTNGNACNGNVYCEDTRNSMILAQDKLVTCVGLDDVIVIETGDSVLVARKSCGNSLKSLVNVLRNEKRHETVAHALQEHRWGNCRPVLQSKNASVRECLVQKDQSLSSEARDGTSQWIIADGQAVFVIDGQAHQAGKDEIVTMPSGKPYEIINKGMGDLKLYEIEIKGFSTNVYSPFRDVPMHVPVTPPDFLRQRAGYSGMAA